MTTKNKCAKCNKLTKEIYNYKYCKECFLLYVVDSHDKDLPTNEKSEKCCEDNDEIRYAKIGEKCKACEEIVTEDNPCPVMSGREDPQPHASSGLCPEHCQPQNEAKHECEENIYGVCYTCGKNMLSPKESTEDWGEGWREYCVKYADKKGKIYPEEASGYFAWIIQEERKRATEIIEIEKNKPGMRPLGILILSKIQEKILNPNNGTTK